MTCAVVRTPQTSYTEVVRVYRFRQTTTPLAHLRPYINGLVQSVKEKRLDTYSRMTVTEFKLFGGENGTGIWRWPLVNAGASLLSSRLLLLRQFRVRNFYICVIYSLHFAVVDVYVIGTFASRMHLANLLVVLVTTAAAAAAGHHYPPKVEQSATFDSAAILLAARAVMVRLNRS